MFELREGIAMAAAKAAFLFGQNLARLKARPVTGSMHCECECGDKCHEESFEVSNRERSLASMMHSGSSRVISGQ